MGLVEYVAGICARGPVCGRIFQSFRQLLQLHSSRGECPECSFSLLTQSGVMHVVSMPTVTCGQHHLLLLRLRFRCRCRCCHLVVVCKQNDFQTVSTGIVIVRVGCASFAALNRLSSHPFGGCALVGILHAETVTWFLNASRNESGCWSNERAASVFRKCISPMSCLV